MRKVSLATYNEDFKTAMCFLVEKTPEQIKADGHTTRKIEVDCKVMIGSMPRKAQYTMALIIDPSIAWEGFNLRTLAINELQESLMHDFKTVGNDHLELLLRVVCKYFECDFSELTILGTTNVYTIRSPKGYSFILFKKGYVGL